MRSLYIGSLDLSPYLNQVVVSAPSVFNVLKTPAEVDNELWILLGGEPRGEPKVKISIFNEEYQFKLKRFYYTELGSGLTLCGDYSYNRQLYLFKNYGSFFPKEQGE